MSVSSSACACKKGGKKEAFISAMRQGLFQGYHSDEKEISQDVKAKQDLFLVSSR